MDVNHYRKERFAQVFVEAMFRWAGYQGAWVGQESHARRGAGELTPHLLLWRNAAPNPDLLLAVEVKYRTSIVSFLSNEIEELTDRIRAQWPEIYSVVVTDTPGKGRSCFQVISLKDSRTGGSQCELIDLHKLPELDIPSRTIAEYEELLRAIFGLLNQMPRDEQEPELNMTSRVDLVQMLQYRVRASSTLPLSSRIELRKLLESLKSLKSEQQ